MFQVLSGLPPYGPMAIGFPAAFAAKGREGYVVEFFPDTPRAWVGNFGIGIGGYSGVYRHPNGVDVIVFAKGSGYIVDPDRHELRGEVVGAIFGVWQMEAPPGLLCDRQGLAFFRIGPDGLLWHTRRLSWDGFRDLVLTRQTISGLANGLSDDWVPFKVTLDSGHSFGGAVPGEVDADWECLASR